MNSLWLLAGLVLGALAAWLALRNRATALAAHAADAARELAETKAELGRARQAAEAASSELRGETARRAAAEAAALRIPALELALTEARTAMAAAGERAAAVEARASEERRAAEDKLRLVEEARGRLGEAFAAAAAEALARSNQGFMDLAGAHLQRLQVQSRDALDARHGAVDALVKPVAEQLDRVGLAVADLGRHRAAADSALHEQVAALRTDHQLLAAQAGRLATALRNPNMRGRWGEIQLRRVVELAGMLDHCDFTEQQHLAGEQARRPDLVVRLPAGRRIAVDAKAPLHAYLAALEAGDEAGRTLALAEHARHIRGHLTALSSKAYWDQFKEGAPEFVVLFLPGETFFSAALEQDPALIEQGVEQRVLIATPTTLIALLKAVAYGWRQTRLEDSARQVAALGHELHQRLTVFLDHFAKLRRGLDGAIEAYNQAAGSLESRVLVSARRLKELGATASAELPAAEPSDKATRGITNDAPSSTSSL
jgi:DNA recombination protein RmuC